MLKRLTFQACLGTKVFGSAQKAFSDFKGDSVKINVDICGYLVVIMQAQYRSIKLRDTFVVLLPTNFVYGRADFLLASFLCLVRQLGFEYPLFVFLA